MRHRGLIEALVHTFEFDQVARGLDLRRGLIAVYGVAEGHKSLVMAAVHRLSSQPVVVVASDSEAALRIRADLEVFFPGEVMYLPPWEFIPYKIYAQSLDNVNLRVSVWRRLVVDPPAFIVTTAEALIQRVVPLDVWKEAAVYLETGRTYLLEELTAAFSCLGYERVPLVEVPGQMSVRGGILDIFPLGEANPLRLEFDGDELVSIRRFSVDDQLSREETKEALVFPARELVCNGKVMERGIARLREECSRISQRLAHGAKTEAGMRLKEKLESYISDLEAGRYPEGCEQFLLYFFPEAGTILDHFSHQTVVILDEPKRIEDSIRGKLKDHAGCMSELVAGGVVLPGQVDIYISGEEVGKKLSCYPAISLSLLPHNSNDFPAQRAVKWESRAPGSCFGQLDRLVEEVSAWRSKRYRCFFFIDTRDRAVRLKEALLSYGIEAPLVKDVRGAVPEGQILIVSGSLSGGFECPGARVAITTEAEIFGQKRKVHRHRAFADADRRITSFAELKKGDYVVHVNHGIGRYEGLTRLKVDGAYRDYLHLRYAGEVSLYVPANMISQIQKYVGAEGHTPKLSRLGSGEWNRVKSRVKASVEEMARELLSLYAYRESAEGYSFRPDTPWQREFEDSFPFTETPDQLKAIQDVKRDMELPRPMDRLLCGDVGYGKTEVALRAAFKAVMDGKQVAVLVPTTILAQQHYRTFQERLKPYPIRVEALSRFHTAREQAEVIEGLKSGTVDIVIGTHRLLSSDVEFHDLGLVIVDEEQRFGVAHKERLKQLRRDVDVLTLTATPIPRTLHMSLAGVRDMSMIETPPEGRYPVQTYVLEYSDSLVRDAILREVARGGQVFFVHNRIADIELVTARLRELVPEARFGIAHGQMPEDLLEQTMLDFMEGMFEVLVSTTIIENGLDMPRVNTLIVDEADNLGLAQLYQLRGRVGRGNRVAYAYFTYRPDKVLSEVAEKRLSAIREFTEFGAGFRIALRDLEIRGAGNLLGPEQHGHMLAVGFELYCRLLEEAIRDLKGQKQEQEESLPAIELPIDAYIADTFIPDSGLKMEVYRRLMGLKNVDHVDQFALELRDRYGELPQGVKNLICMSRLRSLAREIGVREVSSKPGQVRVAFGSDHGIRGEELLKIAAAFPGRISFSATGGLCMTVRTHSLSSAALLDLLNGIFEKLRSVKTRNNLS